MQGFGNVRITNPKLLSEGRAKDITNSNAASLVSSA